VILLQIRISQRQVILHHYEESRTPTIKYQPSYRTSDNSHTPKTTASPPAPRWAVFTTIATPHFEPIDAHGK